MSISNRNLIQKSSTIYTESLGPSVPLLKRDIAMNQQEAKIFIRAAYKRKKHGSRAAIKDWLFCLFAIHTGLRISEIANLKIECIVLDNPTPYLYVKKGKTENSTRCVVLNSRIIEVLNEYRTYKASWKEKWENEEPLFRSPIGNRTHYSRYGLYEAFRRVLNLADKLESKKRFHPHSLRHTFATLLGQVTSSMAVQEPNYQMIRDLLGHASIETTVRYITTFSPRIVEALEEYASLIHPKNLC